MCGLTCQFYMMAVSPGVYMGHPCGCQLSEVKFPSAILDDVGDEAGQAIQEVFRLSRQLHHQVFRQADEGTVPV